jgi:hypothetical protein
VNFDISKTYKDLVSMLNRGPLEIENDLGEEGIAV